MTKYRRAVFTALTLSAIVLVVAFVTFSVSRSSSAGPQTDLQLTGTELENLAANGTTLSDVAADYVPPVSKEEAEQSAKRWPAAAVKDSVLAHANWVNFEGEVWIVSIDIGDWRPSGAGGSPVVYAFAFVDTTTGEVLRTPMSFAPPPGGWQGDGIYQGDAVEK